MATAMSAAVHNTTWEGTVKLVKCHPLISVSTWNAVEFNCTSFGLFFVDVTAHVELATVSHLALYFFIMSFSAYCSSSGTVYTCACSAGYTGTQCETRKDVAAYSRK